MLAPVSYTEFVAQYGKRGAELQRGAHALKCARAALRMRSAYP
jgi:hypothetical protein